MSHSALISAMKFLHARHRELADDEIEGFKYLLAYLRRSIGNEFRKADESEKSLITFEEEVLKVLEGTTYDETRANSSEDLYRVESALKRFAASPSDPAKPTE